MTVWILLNHPPFKVILYHLPDSKRKLQKGTEKLADERKFKEEVGVNL